MNDNEKWPRTSPGFNTTREAYEHQGATVDRIIARNTPTDDERGDVNTAIDYLDELIGVYSHRVDVQRVLRWVIGRLRLPAPPKATIHSDPDPLWDRLYGDGTQMMPPAKAPEPSADPAPSGWRSAPTESEPDRIVPQEEPSDAQVEAAWAAYMDYPATGSNWLAMRAALRAAMSLREGGVR